ncbi:MAG: ATP-dependent chaperone ClpB [Bdellovibrionota bacterium]
MNFEKYTEMAQKALAAAQKLAETRSNPMIEPVHLAQSLIEEATSPVTQVLKDQNKLDAFKDVCAQITKTLPNVSGQRGGLGLANDLQAALQQAETLATQMGDQFVTVEHFFLALLMVPSTLSQKLSGRGFDLASLKNALVKKRGGQAKASSATAEESFGALEKYSKDLTELAAQNKLDPVIGRDEEIRRVIQVLSRRTKNNPVLIGEPGVGKTAIAEGLAQRIIKGDVPESLKGKKVRSLDLGGMVAGAKYRGEFEERLKGFLKEVQDAQGEIILFIDELHTLIGAGKTDGAMDAGNLLKPALARGELRCVGATTLDEYRKYIEKDPALERRFQQVYVGEPSVEEAISILRGLKEKYEVHHGVRIQDAAIIAAAQLSNRYITDRFLPDKAIDLMDEAAAKLRIEIDSMPTAIDERVREVMQLEVEREALKKEKDNESQRRLGEIEAKISSEKEQIEELKGHWLKEKEQLLTIRRLNAESEQLATELAQAERSSELQKAAEIKYGKLPLIAKSIETAQKALRDIQSEKKMLKEEVEAEDIAHIVSRWTGVPVDRMLQGEGEKLLKLEDRLRERVRGQDDALRAVADAVRLARSGLKDPTKPIGSFLFLGPTGVGKTETAKALAEFLFDDESAMVRIDMSEYMEKHSVSRFIGAPPGYVGFEEGGQLTEMIRRRPYAVVLLDEIEKAHPDVLNVLLQILDDGRLTDGQGRVVDFRNVVVIMTSNIGSDLILDSVGESEQKLHAKLMDQLRNHLRPEFINRIDETIVFHSLDMKLIREIVDIQVKSLNKILLQRKLVLRLDDDAKDYLAHEGYDPQFGARPLKRAIYRKLQVPLSKKLLEGAFSEGDTVEVHVSKGSAEEKTLVMSAVAQA